MATDIDPGWQTQLEPAFASDNMQALRSYLRSRKDRRAVIYPHSSNWFRAFQLTPFDKVRVVIIGQDPYHGPGQAHGLSFSVREGVAPPPSLQNIFREIDDDINGGAAMLSAQRNGCLEAWAEQGVFLLNSVLTVERGEAHSHRGRGWEEFTDTVIRILDREREHLVFLLWGGDARKKAAMIDRSKHLVLESAHPSPLSAHRGFLGSRHFSKTNAWLEQHGEAPIDWMAVGARH